MKTLQIIHFVFCTGVIFCYLLTGSITIDNLNILNIDGSSLVYLGLPVIAFVLSDFLFKNQLKQADTNRKVEENFPVYQSASLIRWTVLVGAAMLIAVLKPDFIIFGMLMIAYLAFVKPTETRMKKDLGAL